MNRYTATFADGTTITRGTKNEYSHAWRQTWSRDDGGLHSVTGFSSVSNPSPSKPKTALVYRGMSSNRRAAANKANAEFLARSGYKFEVVPAVLS